MFHFPLALVDPGDVVLVPSPGYPPYGRGTLFAGGTPWFYPITRERGWLPDLAAVPADVARRARILWINYPNSPSGALAPPRFLEEAAAWCRERGIVLASDEGERVMVPEEAVIYAGPRRLVFVDLGEGRLQPREIEVGLKAGERYEVLSGLDPGEVVVTSGNSLIAAESRLKSATEHW